MSSSNKLREDVAYVRAVAQRSGPGQPTATFVFWAVVAVIGFALVDFASDPRWIGWFWLVAAPFGVVFSAWLGIRHSRRVGQKDSWEGIRWGLHWLSFLGVGLLSSVLVATEQLTWSGYSSIWLLFLALTYFLAGLHLDRRLLPVGLVAAVGYVITLFVPDYGWTITGILFAAALLTLGYLGVMPRGQTS